MTPSLSPDAAATARPFASFQMRAEVRLFHTNRELACREDPDLFFDPRRKHAAVTACVECPFRGRCGYNAVAMGATHGIWGGVMLPGDYPSRLKPVYARLAEQFELRRLIELGDVPVVPLPDPDADTCTATDDRGPCATRRSTTRADTAPDRTRPLGSGHARRPGLAPPQWPLDNSRIASSNDQAAQGRTKEPAPMTAETHDQDHGRPVDNGTLQR